MATKTKETNTQTEAEQLFDKMFFKKDGTPNFEKLWEVYDENHPNSDKKEAYMAAVRHGWGLSKIQGTN